MMVVFFLELFPSKWWDFLLVVGFMLKLQDACSLKIAAAELHVVISEVHLFKKNCIFQRMRIMEC